jgi:hypothetical protein
LLEAGKGSEHADSKETREINTDEICEKEIIPVRGKVCAIYLIPEK